MSYLDSFAAASGSRHHWCHRHLQFLSSPATRRHPLSSRICALATYLLELRHELHEFSESKGLSHTRGCAQHIQSMDIECVQSTVQLTSDLDDTHRGTRGVTLESCGGGGYIYPTAHLGREVLVDKNIDVDRISEGYDLDVGSLTYISWRPHTPPGECTVFYHHTPLVWKYLG